MTQETTKPRQTSNAYSIFILFPSVRAAVTAYHAHFGTS